MNTLTVEKKTCDYNHLLLYAKSHYERGDVIQDVKTILAERCGLKSAENVSNEDVWAMSHHALLKYCRDHIDHFLRELFKPRYGEEDYADFRWFSDSCPLSRAVSLVLTHLARVKVVDDNGNTILELGSPDPSILPLGEMAKKRMSEGKTV